LSNGLANHLAGSAVHRHMLASEEESSEQTLESYGTQPKRIGIVETSIPRFGSAVDAFRWRGSRTLSRFRSRVYHRLTAARAGRPCAAAAQRGV
jgi:hypothetical protein